MIIFLPFSKRFAEKTFHEALNKLFWAPRVIKSYLTLLSVHLTFLAICISKTADI